jgi:putative transposase
MQCNGKVDHVHLLIQYPPTVELTEQVNPRARVFPSRRLRAWYFIHTHRQHLWSPSQLAASCGGPPSSIINAYIQDQRHQTNAATPNLKDQACATQKRGEIHP